MSALRSGIIWIIILAGVGGLSYLFLMKIEEVKAPAPAQQAQHSNGTETPQTVSPEQRQKQIEAGIKNYIRTKMESK